jgi:hypothetical protein
MQREVYFPLSFVGIIIDSKREIPLLTPTNKAPLNAEFEMGNKIKTYFKMSSKIIFIFGLYSWKI